MAIYRGTGGSGDASTNASITEVTQQAVNAANSATAAASSATAAAASASLASTSAADAIISSGQASGYASSALLYSGQAATSATNASNSAGAASTSAGEASTSETLAGLSAANAASYASAAATSAANAATSATNAATNASSAATDATNAATSASSASTSASNAAASETAAASSASSATTDATNAATSATNAASSETNAAASETAAASSETAAAASETAAAASETAAASSASTASTAASSASSSATAAASSATAASSSASAASTSETNAASSASAASSSASDAATSATASAASASSAASSAAAAAASYDSFDDRYLGVKSSAPTLDNDGNALVTGALYYNDGTVVTDDKGMWVYDGSQWLAASSAAQAILTVYNYTATSSQTTFSGVDDNAATLAYNQGCILVTLNGVLLEDGTDYTATTGTSVVLSSGATAGDEINIHSFNTFDIANVQAIGDDRYVRLSTDQTVAGVKTLSSNPILSGGTANGVAYLNGSKALTSGSALKFDGTNLGVNSILDASGGSTATVNGYTPTASNMAGRNRIINGDMRIDQRNAGASVSTASNSSAYTLDRWTIEYSQFSKFTLQQNAGSVTPPVGYTNYLGITSSSAYSLSSTDYFLLEQRIEGFNSGDLAWGTANAKNITVSFWVRSSLTGAFGGAIRNQAGTRSYPFSFTISAANTWEQKTVTIQGDTSGTWLTNNSIGIRLALGIGLGSTFTATAGTWATGNYLTPTGSTSVVGTSGATFYITGVQLEEGSVATPFEHRQYGQELALCQRYYWKESGSLYGGVYGTTTGVVGASCLPVTMRSTPTLGYTAVRTTSGLSALPTRSSALYIMTHLSPYVTGLTASAEL